MAGSNAPPKISRCSSLWEHSASCWDDWRKFLVEFPTFVTLYTSLSLEAAKHISLWETAICNAGTSWFGASGAIGARWKAHLQFIGRVRKGRRLSTTGMVWLAGFEVVLEKDFVISHDILIMSRRWSSLSRKLAWIRPGDFVGILLGMRYAVCCKSETECFFKSDAWQGNRGGVTA